MLYLLDNKQYSGYKQTTQRPHQIKPKLDDKTAELLIWGYCRENTSKNEECPKDIIDLVTGLVDGRMIDVDIHYFQTLCDGEIHDNLGDISKTEINMNPFLKQSLINQNVQIVMNKIL